MHDPTDQRRAWDAHAKRGGNPNPLKSWDRVDTLALILIAAICIGLALIGRHLTQAPAVASEEQPAPAGRPSNWMAE